MVPTDISCDGAMVTVGTAGAAPRTDPGVRC
jgi:hypothetical protein